MASVASVVNYFLGRSEVTDDYNHAISPLKLQKLLYYAQAWYVALVNKSNNGRLTDLFEGEEDAFEAWAHGPVLRRVYIQFKDYGYRRIPLDTSEVEELGELGELNDTEQQVLDFVWGMYGHLEAKELEKLTHSEDPWIDARGNLPEGYSSNEPISLQSMFDYYSQQLEVG